MLHEPFTKHALGVRADDRYLLREGEYENIMRQPSLFISHGGPDIVLGRSEVAAFLAMQGREILERSKPDAIVIASAHFETGQPRVVSDPKPGMIYDFGGFQPELYQMTYPAPGSPPVASVVLEGLKAAGFAAEAVSERGYDHGAWTILKLMFPDADIPVVQVSIQPQEDASHHFALGKALAKLRDSNILVIGSGHITHNLRAVFAAMRHGHVDQTMVAKTKAFTGWIADHLVKGEIDEVLNWRTHAPHALENHPTPEHLMPLFVAAGAGGEKSSAKLLHKSVQHGLLQSDIWEFN